MMGVSVVVVNRTAPHWHEPFMMTKKLSNKHLILEPKEHGVALLAALGAEGYSKSGG